tara:strand:+ start:220 stop:546 length:327 start_codon:yes stop_codon:yes gene_type:complete
MGPELRKFVEYDRDNPHVYDWFKKFTTTALARGHDRLSAWLIMNRVRWETTIETISVDGFKISNHHFAYYARMYMYENPEYAGFFRTKHMRNENEIQEWLETQFEVVP